MVLPEKLEELKLPGNHAVDVAEAPEDCRECEECGYKYYGVCYECAASNI